ncbi:hypothetical protein BACCELL_05439 [Bacteroides cellulosilyticus DSM 14838]|uniref:Uncharacterized protein n=1 Tax=Bacteroides cellulosilyticus DSM 14838 TaxID=537012 RepID=E2NM94_9BACE|nr:hypothetical protein BACCELL_05439 [Bacteroides cellulosilyticus DSM 14838]
MFNEVKVLSFFILIWIVNKNKCCIVAVKRYGNCPLKSSVFDLIY